MIVINSGGGARNNKVILSDFALFWIILTRQVACYVVVGIIVPNLRTKQDVVQTKCSHLFATPTFKKKGLLFRNIIALAMTRRLYLSIYRS